MFKYLVLGVCILGSAPILMMTYDKYHCSKHFKGQIDTAELARALRYNDVESPLTRVAQYCYAIND